MRPADVGAAAAGRLKTSLVVSTLFEAYLTMKSFSNRIERANPIKTRYGWIVECTQKCNVVKVP